MGGVYNISNPSSTGLSPRSRNVHLIWHFGGDLQVKAMIWASMSPVTFAGIGGVTRFLRASVAASSFS